MQSSIACPSRRRPGASHRRRAHAWERPAVDRFRNIFAKADQQKFDGVFSDMQRFDADYRDSKHGKLLYVAVNRD
jgi:hypothetical protein